MKKITAVFCWIMGLYLLSGVFSPLRADYDPVAEIQRLIDRAEQEKVKDKALLVDIEADIKATSKAFGQLNGLEETVNDVLRKTRSIDVRNRGMLAFKSGLSFTKVYPEDSLVEFTTEFIVDRAQDMLQEKWPKVFDTSVSRAVGAAAQSSIAAVQKLNWAVSLSDQEVAGYVRMETPELAAKEGSISDDLIALKHSQLIIEAGNRAVSVLEELKRLALERYRMLLALKGAVEGDIRRLDEDIRSWNRQLELQGVYKKASESSKEPSWPDLPKDPSYDFGTAAGNINEAWNKLAAKTYSCGGYDAQVWDAVNGATRKRNELIEPYYRNADRVCSHDASSDACRAAWAYASSAAQNIYNNYEQQVQGALTAARTKAQELADGPIAAFAQSYNQWAARELTVQPWGDDIQVKMEGQHGEWLGSTIWQYALSQSSGSGSWQPYYPLPLKQLLDADARFAEWVESSQTSLRYYEKRFKDASTASGQAISYAAEASALGKTLEPNVELWECFHSRGTSSIQSPLFNTGNLRYHFDTLRHFEDSFTSVSKAGQDAGQRLIESAKATLEKTRKVVEVLKESKAIGAQVERVAVAAGALRRAEEGGSLDSSGGRIYAYLGNFGINESGLKALAARIDALNSPDAIEQEALRQIVGAPGYDFKNRVLDEQGIADVKKAVRTTQSQIDSARQNYKTGFADYQEADRKLDAMLKQMREKLLDVFPAQVASFFKETIFDEYGDIQDRLNLSLVRNAAPNPDELPDSSLGVGPLIERYQVLAARYHALVDPMMPLAKANQFAPALEELLKKLNAEAGSMQGLGAEAFMQASNRYSNDAYRLYERAAQFAEISPKSRVSVAYGAIIGKLSEIAGEYYGRQRLAKAETELKSVVSAIRDFLGDPEARGGAQSARMWIDSAGYTKAGVDSSVVNRPSIQGLLKELDGLLVSLREIANRVDSASLQRDVQAIEGMYRDFAQAYSRKNLPQLLGFLSPEWQASDGSDIRELESTLSDSFRVFDSIEFKISGLGVQRVDDGYQVKYNAQLTGRIRRLQKVHQESSDVTDRVILTPDGPRIQKTTGGQAWTSR